MSLATGFKADSCRFDIQWWTNHGYKYHYSEHDLEFRFGWETRPETAYLAKHFDPPEEPAAHRESCITYEEPKLVTLAVINCWWTALENHDLSLLNAHENPP